MVNINTAAHIICLALLSFTMQSEALGEDFTDAIRAYLQQRVEAQQMSGCIVVGIVDDHGSRVVSYGKLDNGTDKQADGDTLFNIYSATGTFTHLLLQDMADRGELNLDDPVAKYLPGSVHVPTYNGKQITLRILAKETSGLPDFYPGLNPKRADNYLADFGIEQFDDFVSACQLTTDPGTTHLHGPIDLTLLAQAMSTKAGADYELLMAARILEPLKMHDTVFTLTPELKERLAHEHSPFGYAIQPWNWGIHKPSAGLYSVSAT
jgi:CubicO group peptidase (beta-lactamase class C family)